MLNQQYEICIVIPVFNREQEVGATIDSIITARQACINPEKVGLFFQDGGSTDGTIQVLSKYAESFEWIDFAISSVNGGVDLDTDIGVKNANSRYVWLFSSDDIMSENALKRVEELTRHDRIDIILASRANYTRDMSASYGKQSWFTSNRTVFEYIRGDDSLANYVRKTKSLGGIFSYMPAIICLRERWMEETVNIPLFMNGTNYRHVSVLLRILLSGAYLYSEADVLILCRSFNDSFHEEGSIGRFVIDYKGYDKVIKSLVCSNLLNMAIRECVRRELGILRIVRVIGSISSVEDRKVLQTWLAAYNYSSITRYLFAYLSLFACIRKTVRMATRMYYFAFK